MFCGFYRLMQIQSFLGNSVLTVRFRRWTFSICLLVCYFFPHLGGVIAGVFVLNVILYRLIGRLLAKRLGFEAYYFLSVTRFYVKWVCGKDVQIPEAKPGTRFYEIHVGKSRIGREQIRDMCLVTQRGRELLGGEFIIIGNTWASVPTTFFQRFIVMRIENDTRLVGNARAKRPWNFYVITERVEQRVD
jgi:hypothetical protein